MKALTIDRSELLAGDTLNILTGGDGALHNRGFFCCLGLYLRELGVTPTQMGSWNYPSEVGLLDCGDELEWLAEAPKVPLPKAVNCTNRVETAIAEINDSVMMPEERERLIAALFAQGGIELTWTGDYEAGTARAYTVVGHE